MSMGGRVTLSETRARRDGESEEAFLSISTSPPGGEGNTLRPSRRVRTIAIFAVLLSAASLVAGMVVARGQAGFFVHEDGTTLVQDFASHLTFTRGVWRGEVAEVESAALPGISNGERAPAFVKTSHALVILGSMNLEGEVVEQRWSCPNFTFQR